ncbi:uncharacterized protein LOC103940099 [Pyrus x bretschneideri]|uniref:uncharacterized protein LOC103940099 n=1 Tax=Pyrus x bretschneideri TaxID=225117 RepID=UPI0008706A7E|nr:uncharacterized protein LOC103940099 [Pyrus x bretschneideri]
MNHISLCFSVSPFRSLSCETHSSTEIIRTSEEMESVSGVARRPCFIDEDDGLASLADMEAGFSGSNHPFYSRPMCFARRSGSFRNVSPAMASFSSSSSFSPRSGRFCDARFEEHHQPHFLDACFLCKKPLGDNRDIFMYSHSLRSLFSLVSPPPFPVTLPSLLSPICLPRDSAISLVPIISLFSLIYLPRDSAISLFSLISNTHSISIRILKTLHLFQSIHSPLSHNLSKIPAQIFFIIVSRVLHREYLQIFVPMGHLIARHHTQLR